MQGRLFNIKNKKKMKKNFFHSTYGECRIDNFNIKPFTDSQYRIVLKSTADCRLFNPETKERDPEEFAVIKSKSGKYRRITKKEQENIKETEARFEHWCKFKSANYRHLLHADQEY